MLKQLIEAVNTQPIIVQTSLATECKVVPVMASLQPIQLVELPLADIELDNDSGSSVEATDKESDASTDTTPALSPREITTSIDRMEVLRLDQVVRTSYASIAARKIQVKSADAQQKSSVCNKNDGSWRDQPRMQPRRGRHFSASNSQRTSANNSTIHSAVHSNAGSRDRSPTRRRSLGGDELSSFGNKLRARLQKLQSEETDFDWNKSADSKWTRSPTLGVSTPMEQTTTYARGPDGSRGFARHKSVVLP
jgi:hypothetical protein